MNSYTVLLLRPDYMADEFGKDTYLAHVEADDVESAQRAAQEEVALADCSDGEPDEEYSPEDYHVLFVATGHLDDLSVR